MVLPEGGKAGRFAAKALRRLPVGKTGKGAKNKVSCEL